MEEINNIGVCAVKVRIRLGNNVYTKVVYPNGDTKEENERLAQEMVRKQVEELMEESGIGKDKYKVNINSNFIATDDAYDRNKGEHCK